MMNLNRSNAGCESGWYFIKGNGELKELKEIQAYQGLKKPKT